MKRLAATALAAFLAVSPAHGGEGELGEGLDLMGEGARRFMQGLMQDMEPALREFAETAGPTLQKLMGMIGDLDDYEMPERLPNGDIILRRKTPPDTPPDDTTPGGEGPGDEGPGIEI